ncbi:MAG: adenosine kinase [Deltaproteobacteria bacterium CG07_land_8_20_14_0_80_38_7]|nr:MAG: adenosine kinase [Deltaproteobacteria bacterium CG07_land_8_20_14_0_80_38_7]
MTKVLGMGNALVDVMTQLDSESLLQKFSLPKGSMQLVDETFIEKILNETTHLKIGQSSGGSAANVIHGLASLGVKTGFLGKVSDDEFGNFFSSDLTNNGIESKLFQGKARSGISMALISPDSERTFATHLGAAIELNESDLSEHVFSGYKYFHIEGYLVQNYSLIEKAVKLAKESGLCVSLDLASYNVVEENIDFLKNLVSQYVDIVFANEDEAKAYTGCDPEKAVEILSLHAAIAVVKLGKKGSLIRRGNNTFRIGVVNADCIDTTGAGDLYAAGFLYGLVNGLPLDKCGEIGSVLSGKVVEVVGAKLSRTHWTDINKLIKKIV